MLALLVPAATDSLAGRIVVAPGIGVFVEAGTAFPATRWTCIPDFDRRWMRVQRGGKPGRLSLSHVAGKLIVGVASVAALDCGTPAWWRCVSLIHYSLRSLKWCSESSNIEPGSQGYCIDEVNACYRLLVIVKGNAPQPHAGSVR